jgi:ABC-2 type transport system permease protein
MTGFRPGGTTLRRSVVQFAVLLKVQAKLAVREPIGLFGGLALPAVLLAVFGFIGQANPGDVGSTGLSIIQVWTPTIMVLSFIFIAVSLPNTLVRDREIGWLRRISTTPLHPSRLLAAQLTIDLILAAAAVLILILESALVFGASLHVQILPFAVSLLLSIIELFAFGLMLVALMPTQTVASAVGGVFTFGLMFLSGLWVNPAQIGDPLRTIMYYSPSGAAVKAVLDSAFNGSLSCPALLTMAVYTLIFGFVAIRYFRWE